MSASPSVSAFAVVALLVLAGCNAPAADPPATGTVTAAPVPDPSATPTASDRLAPGVRESGVDSHRLAAAHATALRGTSYTVNQTVVDRYANGTIRSRYVTLGGFSDARGRFVATLTRTDRRNGTLTTRTIRRFGDGDRAFVATTEGGTTTYRLLTTPGGAPRDPATVFPENLTNARAVARVFRLVEARPVGTFTANGTRFVRLRSVAPASLPPLANVTLSATVSERGLVRAYRISYDFERDGTRIETVVSLSYTRVGDTDVERPAWVGNVTTTPD